MKYEYVIIFHRKRAVIYQTCRILKNENDALVRRFFSGGVYVRNTRGVNLTVRLN